ncbi:hypothetical protein [Propionivibrio sp.]
MQPLEGDHHHHTHCQQQDDLNQMIHRAYELMIISVVGTLLQV